MLPSKHNFNANIFQFTNYHFARLGIITKKILKLRISLFQGKFLVRGKYKMNETQETGQNTVTEACRKLESITDYTVKADYDLTLQSLPSKNSAQPDCVHHFKGNIKRNMLCMLAVGGIIAGAAAALLLLIHGCCYIMCRKK